MEGIDKQLQRMKTSGKKMSQTDKVINQEIKTLYGKHFPELVNNLSTEILLKIGEKVCSGDYIRALEKSVRNVWIVGTSDHREQILKILEVNLEPLKIIDEDKEEELNWGNEDEDEDEDDLNIVINPYARSLVRQERERLNANCCNCTHMIKNECEYGLEENEDELNGCEDHEYR